MNPRILIFCALVLYLTHFFHLGTLPFFGGDEPRYARIGEEMNLTGNFVTPTLTLIPWMEKPPLLFWLEAASYRVVGVSESGARLPVALLSTLCILFSAFFLSRFRNSRAAVLVFLILCSSGLYFAYARAASTDMPLVATFAVAMMAAFLAGQGRALGWAALSGFSLGLAVLAKGPIALVLFLGIYGAYSLLTRRWLWTWKQTLVGAGSMVGTALPWFWLVWQQNGYNFIATFFINHHLARYLTPIHRHSQPFWFYLAVLPLGFFPWSCFLPSSLVRLWKTGPKLLAGTPSGKVQGLELFLWTWVFFPFLFFSFSESKLAGYILPVFPALALLAALEWERFLAAETGVVTHFRRQLAGLTVSTFLIALTLVAGSWYAYETPIHGIYLAAPLVTGALWARREQRKGRTAPLFLTLVASMTVFAALAYGLAASNIGSYHSTRELALQAKPWISQDQPLILYRCFHHTALYYTNYQATPEPIPDMDSLLRYFDDHPQQRYFILVKLGGLSDLQEHWDLPKVSRRGAFYLVELVPPKPLGRDSRALSGPSSLPAPHREFPPQPVSSQPDTDIRRTSSARIPPFESSNR